MKKLKNINGETILTLETGRNDLQNADLHDVNLQNADLHDVNLQNADLHNANLQNADLRGADLRDADLCCAKLSNANFSGADLRDADLRGADLRDADLRGADLCCAKLSNANFAGADLCCAKLSNANFAGADLRDADLRGAKLSNANFSGADLRGAKLDDCEQYRFGLVVEKDIIGFKKVYGSRRTSYVIQIVIPKGATVFCINGKKCRTNKCIVGACYGQVLHSAYDECFTYKEGKKIEIGNFDNRYNVECGTGIHFFKDHFQAEKY